MVVCRGSSLLLHSSSLRPCSLLPPTNSIRLSSSCCSVRRIFPNSSFLQPFAGLRPFAAIAPADLKNGVYFIYNGHYCEAKECRLVKQGRGAVSTAVDYYDLSDKKLVTQKFHQNMRVERIDVLKSTVQIMNVEPHARRIISIDDNLDEVLSTTAFFTYI
eukprot:GHVS01107318.1.p1 GENE.GHVS01107318.1~~GHVS01107318.1.p1  ORF type:complete len:160 (-),score=20.62 GHVS01107318.1:847-1326(-)